MAALNYCVESAARHAKAFHGAVQYMQGCGLMVSFNAASRIASHESKACSFVLALREDMGRFGGPRLLMHASVVTTGIVSFFAGNKGQLMLTVLGPFMAIHTAMHQYLALTLGDDCGCVLLSERSAGAVETLFALRRIGGVHPQQTSSIDSANSGRIDTPIIKMIELVSRRQEDGNHQEWMYELAKQDDGDPHAAVRRIVDAALQGHIPEDLFRSMGWPAVSFNRSISPQGEQPPSDLVLERCVKSRLALCAEHPSDFVVHTPSVVMW